MRLPAPVLRLVAALLGAAMLPAAASAQVSIRWFGFDPVAVRTTQTAPVDFTAEITGTYSAVRLDLIAGGSQFLTNTGGGVWTTSVAASAVLHAYSTAYGGHNHVGYLRIFQGATQLLSLNVIANVVDAAVPDVAVTALDSTTAYSCRVVNVHRPDLTFPPSGALVQQVTQQFYQHFADDFDQLNVVFSLPAYQANRFHFHVRNDVAGIGLSVTDLTALYGSAGTLTGINQYPIDAFFDLAETGNIHEIGHQWINFCDHPLLTTSGAHWPPGTQARGVMGSGAGQGITFPYSLVPIAGGNYQMVSAPRLREFTDLDLYLMGLLGAADVDSNFVFSSPTQPVCHLCSGPVSWFTVDDVIAAQGPRVPDVTTSQKEWRIGTIVVTRDRLLTATEMTSFDTFAGRGEATVALPFRSGLEVGTTLPFHLATGGRGTLVTDVCSAVATDAPPAAGAAGSAPGGLHLHAGVPNPFRDGTRLRFDLPRPQSVRLTVHDVAGRLVRELTDGPRAAGIHAVTWDGRDGDAQPLPAGVYFARLVTEDGAAVQRMLRLR